MSFFDPFTRALGWPVPDRDRPATDAEVVAELRALLADRRRARARALTLYVELLDRARTIRGGGREA